GSVVVLRGDSGMGKTAILRKVHAAEGGAFFSVRQFMDALMSQPPAAIEEAFLHMIDKGLTSHDLVIVDDLHLISAVAEGFSYPRAHLLDATLTAILADSSDSSKKLLFGTEGWGPGPVRLRAYSWG